METKYPELSDYYRKCDNIFVRNNKGVKDICKKILMYLEESVMCAVEEPGHDACLLLNYYIYDKLIHISSYKNATDIAFCIFQILSSNAISFKKNISPNEKCKNKSDILNKGDWKKRKEFYY